jgi:hypothetical protein
MTDEIIEELWQIKDSIAREHNYDVEKLVAHLRNLTPRSGRHVVDLAAIRKAARERVLPPQNPHA